MSLSRSSGVATDDGPRVVGRALGHAGEHRAGSELDELGDAEVDQLEQTLLPPHRRRQLGRQQAGPLRPGPVGERVDVGDHGDLGVARCPLRRWRCAADPARSIMNGVWNAPDTCSGITFLAPSSLA